jgi:DNA-3-methyladenine glycosylase II
MDEREDAESPHDHLRRTDLAPLVEQHGPVELTVADDPFERTVVSIVNQLISTEAARTIRSRLFERFEVTPSAMLDADEDALREVGLSPQKVEYVKNVARWFEREDVTRDRFEGMTDQAVVAELTDVRGVGDWTAKMFLCFCLGREDVFPVEDLAVRRAMTDVFGDETRAAMRERATAWRPYRTYAALYLWSHHVEGSAVDDPVA